MAYARFSNPGQGLADFVRGEGVNHGGGETRSRYALYHVHLFPREYVMVHDDDGVRPHQLHLEGHQLVVPRYAVHIPAFETEEGFSRLYVCVIEEINELKRLFVVEELEGTRRYTHKFGKS